MSILLMVVKGCVRNFRVIATCIFCIVAFAVISQPASALGPACLVDCIKPKVDLKKKRAESEKKIKDHIEEKFEDLRDFIIGDLFEQKVKPAMQDMATQLSAVGVQQMLMVGTLFDSKHQLETQRTLQELQAQAHKDYHPSEGLCEIGTNVRSLAHSEARGRFNALAMSQISMQRRLGKINKHATQLGVNADRTSRQLLSASTPDYDKRARLVNWRRFYCDPKDNNWSKEGGEDSGIGQGCIGSAEFANIDIDYTRLIDEPRTIDVDFSDANEWDLPSFTSDSREARVLALSKNLYGHDVLSRGLNANRLRNEKDQELYMALRSVAAKRSVAEHSFQSIVGLKSEGSSDEEGGENPKTRQYLGAVMAELGMPEEEISDILGEQPSYYAQLEILAKKIYQSPDFYANLYDKPVNVERKAVALKAIELMLERAIYESQLRQEMAMSVLLSSKLRPQFRSVKDGL